MTSGSTYRAYFPSLLVKELGRTIGAPSLPIVVAGMASLSSCSMGSVLLRVLRAAATQAYTNVSLRIKFSSTHAREKLRPLSIGHLGSIALFLLS
jgi:hypothetical protein